MADDQEPVHTTSSPSGRAVRIVLFGMPDAGKSSLLGALAQAAQTQEHILSGKLIDKTRGLMELQRRLYEGQPRQTLQEVVPFPIALEALNVKPAAADQRADATLIDCDGRVANDLLMRKDALTGDMSKRALTREVLAADALVLTIDVSAELAELKRDFGQFSRFLRALERARGRRVEVEGLPVYLVLTKCDLLAKPADTNAMWLDRIEENKRQVHGRFQEFLAQQAEREQMPFGKIDLHVWATAVKRPALADAPARPKEPYGVAELFRQALDAARAFRGRRQAAAGHLAWTVGVALGLVALLVVLALLFLATRHESELARFEKELRSYRSSQGESAAERLREPLSKTITELQAFEASPYLAQTPQELQTFVADQLREAQAYQKLSQEIQAQMKADRLPEAPRFAINQADLEGFRRLLQQNPLPPAYQSTWEDTDLARRQRQWKDEIEIMESEAKAAVKTFAELKLLDAKIKDRENYTGKQLDEFLAELRFKDRTLLYRGDNHATVRKSRVTYSNIARFEPVALLIAQYQSIRDYHKLDAGK